VVGGEGGPTLGFPVGVPPGPEPAAAAQAEAAEFRDRYLRAEAELQNVRKRAARDVAAAQDRGVAKLARELFGALDHLEAALAQAESAAEAPEWIRGVRLVQEEISTALGRVGIQAFAPAGEPFDPNEHEAMAQQPSEDAEPGTVLQVYQQGYRLNGQVLRPARVVVAGGPS
jgi:molecular chaperone GrpE